MFATETETPPRADLPPNIVFVLCDDLGVNDLGCYGRSDHSTPHLDRLAAQGMRFTSAYASQAICSASRAGLLTGLNPARLHLTTFLPGRPDAPSQRVLHPEIALQIPLSVKTWPRYFREAGYATGFIGKWHVGRKPGPKEHGFDFVCHPGDSGNTTPSASEGGKAEYELTRTTLEFIEANRTRPFAAYLGHYTPHIPYAARADLVEKNRDAFEPVYAALIETLDDTVGLLLAKLDEWGLADHTVFVFTSDNGGLHVPEGPHERVTHNTPYRAGKGYTYEGGQRVPTIVRWPGRVQAGCVADAPVNNTDWIPTLLELAGAPAPSGLDGVSFAQGLTGGPFPERKLFWHFPHYTNQGGRPSGAVRDGNWLLIEKYDEDRVELFDLARDIGEKRDVASDRPERAAALRGELDGWRRAIGAQTNAPNPACDERLFQQLYVETDASRFDPLAADESDWARMRAWRQGMNAAIRPPETPRNLLETIIEERRADARLAQSRISIEQLRRRAQTRRPLGFAAALARARTPAVIAELKKASPSAGLLRPHYRPGRMAERYEAAGAVAISVLTEPRRFLGGEKHLRMVRRSVRLPILRKDFLCEPYQVVESAAWGADAILIILAAVRPDEARALYEEALRCGLDVLAEAHTEAELRQALAFEQAIVGVNSRNLKTLKTDLDTARRLAALIPPDRLSVAESGIRSRAEIEELHALGYNGFLIGETLLRAPQPDIKLRELLAGEAVGGWPLAARNSARPRCRDLR